MNALANLRIGYGQDAHRLEAGHPLIIGNVTVESERGAVAHSDGDVLLHALADALLSAFALGDIGRYYPPSDKAFKNINSAEILRGVQAIIRNNVGPVKLQNVAAVVTLDKPKLGSRRDEIRARAAELLGLEPERFGLTFKTSEGLAPDHIQAAVTVLLSAAE